MTLFRKSYEVSVLLLYSASILPAKFQKSLPIPSQIFPLYLCQNALLSLSLNRFRLHFRSKKKKKGSDSLSVSLASLVLIRLSGGSDWVLG